MKENTTKSIMACQKAAHGGLSLSNNPFGEVWGTRRSSKVNSYRPAFPGRSIFAEGAGRALRSFRSPPSGRFALRATAHRADASLRCRAGGEFAPLGANIS